VSRRKDRGDGNQGAAAENAEAEVIHPLDEAYGDRTTRALRDFLTHADMAAEVVSRGRPAYDSDLTLRLAAEAVTSRLGETVARLPDDFRRDHGAVPWRLIRATRNRIGHDYNVIDHALLWAALAEQVPAHAVYVRGVLEADS